MDCITTSKPASRRRFLLKTIALVPAATLSACGSPKSASTGEQDAAPTHAYLPKYFTTEEWAFINAACARLIPADDSGPGAIESGVPAFIDRQLEGPFGHAARWYTQGPYIAAAPEFGYQGKATPREVYRFGITAIDQYCRENLGGKRFSECDAAFQDQLLRDVESGHLAFDRVGGTTFFGWLLQNTKEGYLADPIHGGNKDMGSWKMIGFPGARADFADWVGRQGEHYPLGPVGIAGTLSKAAV